jgi:hypothetical protein
MLNKNKTRRSNGGSATVMPLRYYNPNVTTNMSSNAGHDLLKAMPPIGIRPKIGGKRKTLRKKRKTSGGFVPSIMEGFVGSVSKYIVPIALYAGYKMMTKGKKVSKKSTRKHK